MIAAALHGKIRRRPPRPRGVQLLEAGKWETQFEEVRTWRSNS